MCVNSFLHELVLIFNSLVLFSGIVNELCILFETHYLNVFHIKKALWQTCQPIFITNEGN